MIKKLTLVITLMGTPVVSQEDPCVVLSDLAEQIMENRQGGVPLSDMMRISGDNEMIRTMVLEAYNQPRFNTSSYQLEAIQDFSDSIALICYNAIGSL